MRAILLNAGLTLGLATAAFAQTNSPNVTLKWVADEQNEVTVPVSGQPIRVTLGSRETFFGVIVFKCAKQVQESVLRPIRKPAQIDLTVLAKGECHITFDTNARKYNLWLLAKESTPAHPIAPVRTIRWDETPQ